MQSCRQQRRKNETKVKDIENGRKGDGKNETKNEIIKYLSNQWIPSWLQTNKPSRRMNFLFTGFVFSVFLQHILVHTY